VINLKQEEKFKGKGIRKCRICGGSRALVRAHKLYMFRRCFREVARSIGFKKYG